MYKAISFAFAMAAAGLLCGCGGGGSGSSTTSTASPFTGFYGGAGSVTGTSDAINADIGVASAGILCGTLTDSTTNTKTLLGGVISDQGDISRGSYSQVDSNGTTIASGAPSGQISGTGTTASSPTTVNATLIATAGGQTLTYSFNALQSGASSAKHRKRRRRRHKRSSVPQTPA